MAFPSKTVNVKITVSHKYQMTSHKVDFPKYRCLGKPRPFTIKGVSSEGDQVIGY